MPSRLDSPVLSLSINNISKIDTHNVDNLFGMWTIFSRCAESLENGRRLENLSWRLWNQETFYTGTDSKFRATLDASEDPESSSTRSRSNTSSTESVPSLSCSAGSASSNERYATSSIHSNQSTLSRSGSSKRERHINPVGLAKLMSELNKNEVEHIIEEHARSPTKQPAKPIAVPTVQVAQKVTTEIKASTTSTNSDNSNGSHSSVRSSHSVVRGFGPGLVSHSLRSSTKLATEVSIKETFQTAHKPTQPKKGGMFIVGSDQSDASGSYAESGYGNSLRQVVSGSSKRATFEDKVQTRTIFNEDDDEDDYITEDESAIDDEDLEWDSVSEDGESSSYAEDNMFARIEEPRPNIVSRRSLLSTLLHQGDRAAALARAGTRSAPVIRSRTASPNGPSVAPASPVREAPVSQIGGALAVPMTRNTSTYPLALSPRTTRRNMLATELTESLRKHLLWERQQKNKVANAVLRRRHTAYDMQNMTAFPQQQQDRAGSWNNHFEHGVNEYHLAGW